jgi:hypothetical protein
MEIFDISKIKDYDKNDLEIFLSNESAYKLSGEALLEATLNIPFKNKSKIDKILEKIEYHKKNITSIDDRIRELDSASWLNKYTYWLSGTSTAYGTTGYNSVCIPNYGCSTPIISNANIEVKFVNADSSVMLLEVQDDVFESVLGNYYLIDRYGGHIPLNRVIEIDEESNVGKWFIMMCKNFDRETKLKRVLKDDETQKI